MILQKLEAKSKLCKSILGYILDGVLILDEEIDTILGDVIDVLASDSLSIKYKDVDDDYNPLETAKTKVLTSIEVKATLESIVPLVVSLYRMLQLQKNKAARHIMRYLQKLMKMFKKDLEEVLITDKDVLAEIQFDLDKINRRKAPKRKNTFISDIPDAEIANLEYINTPIPKKMRKKRLSLSKTPIPKIKSSSKTPKSTATMKQSNTNQKSDNTSSPKTRNTEKRRKRKFDVVSSLKRKSTYSKELDRENAQNLFNQLEKL